MSAFPRWRFDVGELRRVVEDEGYGDFEIFEARCRLPFGRLDDLGANGKLPFIWEFRRMALVLDMDMDELFDRVFIPVDPDELEQG